MQRVGENGQTVGEEAPDDFDQGEAQVEKEGGAQSDGRVVSMDVGRAHGRDHNDKYSGVEMERPPRRGGRQPDSSGGPVMGLWRRD